jgi:hypothetical protein
MQATQQRPEERRIVAIPINFDSVGVMLRQPACHVVGEQCRECRSSDARSVGFFERHKIHIGAPQLRYLLWNLLKQLVGETQNFRVRRIGAKKQERFVKADQRWGIGKSRSAQLPKQAGKCERVPWSQRRVWKLPADPDPSGVD